MPAPHSQNEYTCYSIYLAESLVNAFIIHEQYGEHRKYCKNIRRVSVGELVVLGLEDPLMFTHAYGLC
jgi:hypothetical protein